MTKPKKRPVDPASLARSYTELAVNTLAGLTTKADKDSVRVAAATALLDRGWGKPHQENNHSGELKITIRKMLDGK